MGYVLKEAVRALRTARQKLEFEVLHLIKEFEDTTGAMVESIEIQQRNVTLKDMGTELPRPLFEKKVEIKIKL